MSGELEVSVGQYSDRGRKEINQDFHGIRIPEAPQRRAKGIAVALADGISSSTVGHVAAQAAVAGFLEDYFCTPDSWSVKTSAQRVLTALNAWLHAQSQRSPYRYERDRGYVCTLSAMVIKSATAHLFHVGDTRIYRLRDGALEQLTNDHRLRLAEDVHYLGRALGINAQLEIDYRAEALEAGDVFVFATDGVYEHAAAESVVDAVSAHGDDLDRAAEAIAGRAYAQGSGDNLTVQILRIDRLPRAGASELRNQLAERPLPPILAGRMRFDGYTIVRELHGSSRSHVYLAVDDETGARVVLKAPSIELQGDAAYLERFLMEEWVARRVDSAHVLKPSPVRRNPGYLYTAMEFIEGQTLGQWMIDHPRPDLETVRGIVEQIARGLRAFHRLEMLHQDLRPENIMIEPNGTVKIIDFGSTQVAGMREIDPLSGGGIELGTLQYTAPERLLGEGGTRAADLYALGVITYQMLSGDLPYGMQAAQCRTRADQRRLRYRSLRDGSRAIPPWVDDAICKAVHPEPERRYEKLSEFTFDLRHPSPSRPDPPLIERHPLAFWQGLSFVLALVVVALVATLHAARPPAMPAVLSAERGAAFVSPQLGERRSR